MSKIVGICKEVLDRAEWIAIATTGADGPHVVATWGDYVRTLGLTDDEILIPVGSMHKTQANLAKDSRVELLGASRQVRGTHGPGKGCGILGTAAIQTTGVKFDATKAKFPWARAVLVVKVETVTEQL